MSVPISKKIIIQPNEQRTEASRQGVAGSSVPAQNFDLQSGLSGVDYSSIGTNASNYTSSILKKTIGNLAGTDTPSTSSTSPVQGSDVGSLLNGSGSSTEKSVVGDSVEISSTSGDINDISSQANSTEDKGVLQQLYDTVKGFFVGDADNVKQGEQVVADKTAVKDTAEKDKINAEETAENATVKAESDKAKAEQAAADVTAQEATVAQNKTNLEKSKAAHEEAKSGVKAAEAELETAKNMPSNNAAEASAKTAAIAKAEAALAAARSKEAATKAQMEKDEALLAQSQAKLSTLKGVKTTADATAETSKAFKIDADLQKTLMTSAFTAAVNSVNSATQQLVQATTSTSAQKATTTSDIEAKLKKLQEEAQEIQNQYASAYAYANTFGSQANNLSASELLGTGDKKAGLFVTGNNTQNKAANQNSQSSNFGSMTGSDNIYKKYNV